MRSLEGLPRDKQDETACLITLGLSVARLHHAAWILLVVAVLDLWVASMPAFARLITAMLEDQYPAIALERAPAVDAIVVLGAGIASPWAKLDVADRLGRTYALWRAGKGNVIVISGGGNLPWGPLEKPEAELAAAILEEKGVPRDSILIEGASRNTHENAVNVAGTAARKRASPLIVRWIDLTRGA